MDTYHYKLKVSFDKFRKMTAAKLVSQHFVCVRLELEIYSGKDYDSMRSGSNYNQKQY